MDVVWIWDKKWRIHKLENNYKVLADIIGLPLKQVNINKYSLIELLEISEYQLIQLHHNIMNF